MVASHITVRLDEMDFMSLLNLFNKIDSLKDLMHFMNNTEMKSILASNLAIVEQNLDEWWDYFELRHQVRLIPGHHWRFDMEERQVAMAENGA